MSGLHTSLLDHNNPFLLRPLPHRISNFAPVSVSIASTRRNLTTLSSAVERQPSKFDNLIPALATSAALLFLSFGGVRNSACFAATSGRIPPVVSVANDETLVPISQFKCHSGDVGEFDDEEMKAAFESYKSKTYALTVPLRIVALRNSIPPLWIKNFIHSQGKRVKFRLEFRGTLEDIFSELSTTIGRGNVTSYSAGAADIVSLGDTWVNFVIREKLIEPIKGIDDQDWFHALSDKWKVYLHRNNEGKSDALGKIYAVPYRWGSMVIAYRKNKFRQHNLAPIEVNLEFYEITVLHVGCSSNIVPAAKCMSDVAVIVPKSGASLWADLWAIPAASGVATDELGGRIRGPSPLVHQWLDFCLQAQRALPFEEEVVAGASPFAIDNIHVPKSNILSKNKPKLDTNLIAGVPPLDILTRCEFLEPLSDSASSDQ